MNRHLKETVYSPDSELLSFGKLLRNIWSDLLASRELAIGYEFLENQYPAPLLANS